MHFLLSSATAFKSSFISKLIKEYLLITHFIHKYNIYRKSDKEKKKKIKKLRCAINCLKYCIGELYNYTDESLYPFRREMISSATFFPDINIPPKMGPIRGVPDTAEAAIPHTYNPG